MTFKKKFLPFIVLAVFVLLAWVITSNPPTSKRGKPSMAPQLSVEVQTIQREAISLEIDSYGNVQPRTQSILQPQVSGEIKYISTNFRDGGFFEKGELLVKLDARDYQAEIDIAKANLFSAEQALAEEQARVEQAKQDWERLGNEGEPSDLVLRKPQLLATQAKVQSAKATLGKAELALERTEIKAPYTGRILKKEVDIGQVVSQSTRLAEIYAVDYVEVRLPIKNNDLPYIDLPETNRFSQQDESNNPAVQVISELVDLQTWQGKLIRTEGAFDRNSQQLFVVAQIDDPYGKGATEGLPLKIGQYVAAIIQGKTLEAAIKVPNKAIYQGSYVFIVDNGLLKRQEIKVKWQNNEFALIETGLSENDLLVLTPLGQVNSGTPVAVSSKDGKVQKIARKNKDRNRPDKKGPNDKPRSKDARKGNVEQKSSKQKNAEGASS